MATSISSEAAREYIAREANSMTSVVWMEAK
jgi:hypothetical protein